MAEVVIDNKLDLDHKRDPQKMISKVEKSTRHDQRAINCKLEDSDWE